VGAPVLAIVISGLGSNLAQLMDNPRFWQAMVTSLGIAMSAGLLAAMLTYAMARARASLPPGKRAGAFGLLFRFPEYMLLVPPLALGSGWFLILLRLGLADGAGPLLVVLINTGMALPFAARIIAPELTTHLKRTA